MLRLIEKTGLAGVGERVRKKELNRPLGGSWVKRWTICPLCPSRQNKNCAAIYRQERREAHGTEGQDKFSYYCRTSCKFRACERLGNQRLGKGGKGGAGDDRHSRGDAWRVSEATGKRILT